MALVQEEDEGEDFFPANDILGLVASTDKRHMEVANEGSW